VRGSSPGRLRPARASQSRDSGPERLVDECSQTRGARSVEPMGIERPTISTACRGDSFALRVPRAVPVGGGVTAPPRSSGGRCAAPVALRRPPPPPPPLGLGRVASPSRSSRRTAGRRPRLGRGSRRQRLERTAGPTWSPELGGGRAAAGPPRLTSAKRRASVKSTISARWTETGAGRSKMVSFSARRQDAVRLPNRI